MQAGAVTPAGDKENEDVSAGVLQQLQGLC